LFFLKSAPLSPLSNLDRKAPRKASGCQKGLWLPRAKKTQSHTITLIAGATFPGLEFLGNMRTVILTAKTSGTHVFYDTFASPTIETHVFYDTFKLLNSKTSGNTETVAIFHIFFAILPKINEECNHIVYVFSTPLDSNARFF
jgi:hypothetical protein